MVAAPSKHIFVRHVLPPDLLQVVAGLSEHANMASANTFLRVIFGAQTCWKWFWAGKHIPAHHFLRPDLLGVVAGPGKHIFARHFMRLDLLEVVVDSGKHILRHFFAPAPAGSGRGPQQTTVHNPYCRDLHIPMNGDTVRSRACGGVQLAKYTTLCPPKWHLAGQLAGTDLFNMRAQRDAQKCFCFRCEQIWENSAC